MTKRAILFACLLLLCALNGVSKAKNIKYKKLKNSPIYKVDKVLFFALLAQAYSDRDRKGKEVNDLTFAKIFRKYRKAPAFAQASSLYHIVPRYSKTCDFTNDC